MKSELVSTRNGVSISLPIARMQAFTPTTDNRNGRASRTAQREIRVHRGHRVVGHHADAAVQLLEPVRRIRLDDVEDAEQQEAGERAHPADRVEEQRDEHPHHLVDDDLSRIGAAEMALGDVAAPRSGDEDRDDAPTPGRRSTPAAATRPAGRRPNRTCPARPARSRRRRRWRRRGRRVGSRLPASPSVSRNGRRLPTP